ncbi:unnamed protein product [Arabidopsis halleri]
MILKDVPSMIRLPSLKTLQLKTVTFVHGIFLQQLLSGLHVLEDLSMEFFGNTLRECTISIPSLQSLSLFLHMNRNLNRYEIDTPSLKYLKLVDSNHAEEHYSCLS